MIQTFPLLQEALDRISSVSSLEPTTRNSGAKAGLYAEARIGSTVYVYAIEPFPDMAHWLIRTYAALANVLGVDEVTIFYRRRKIRDGVIAPLDLA